MSPKLKIILATAFVFVINFTKAQSPVFQWAKQFVGNTYGSTGNGAAVDPIGNVYTTGTFTGTTDFNPGSGTFTMTAVGTSNIFISKLDASGNYSWAKQVGNSSVNSGNAISIGVSGHIYITGYFSGTADFDPGAGTSYLTSGGTNDIFVLKLSSAGNFIWAKRIGGSNNDIGTSIALDSLENIYTTGQFGYGAVDFDPGTGVYALNGIANQNIFVSKLNSSGDFVWAKYLGDGGEGSGNEIRLDHLNNVYTTGKFSGINSDFDPNAGTFLLNTGGYSGVFISKLSSAGNFVWAKQLARNNTNGHAIGFSIGLDAIGNVYTTGMFWDSVDFNPGTSTYYLSTSAPTQADCFISKLSSSGNFAWARKIGTHHPTSYENEGHSVAVDNNGNIYVTGSFGDTVDFDPGIGVYNMIGPVTTGLPKDAFVFKLNSSGNFIWANQLHSSEGNSISIDALNNFYLTGHFRGTVDFDFAPSVYNLTAIAQDIFINKITQCNLPSATITPAGSTTFCSPGSVTLNANTGAGLTYVWKKNGATISGATGSSYTATTTGNYAVVVSNSCGTSTSAATTVTVSTAIPNTPGSITTTGGIVKLCPGDVRTYTVNNVSTVISYTWTPCAGSVILSGQNTNSVTIQYNSGFPTSDTLRVVANNYCGTSAQRKLKITRNNPATPSSITGDSYGVCNLSGKPYSVTNVAGMTYYWSFNTGTATVASGQGTNAITANFGAGYISGTLSVTATNACGTSTPRAKSVYAKPATPASITGPTAVCLNQQDVPYLIAPLFNTVNYTWVGPSGSHISDGVTTSAGATLITTATSVTVDFATTAGSVKVRGNNACASGSYRTLSVAIVCREGAFADELVETRIYPNPAVNSFTVETDDSSSPFDLEVYDAYGRLIFSDVQLNSGYQVNANGWAAGLYSVIVRMRSNTNILKLVITATE